MSYRAIKVNREQYGGPKGINLIFHVVPN